MVKGSRSGAAYVRVGIGYDPRSAAKVHERELL
jgi:hypothetical protein